jgi:hypothetical protein
VNPDVSVAPEIAQLMKPLMDPPRPATSPARATIGELARELRNITGSPDRWWNLVRFDAGHPVLVGIPTTGRCEAWLSILPPAAGDHGECRCDVVTVVAGELTEPASPKPLLPGQVRVHGTPGGHRAVNTSDGYTVSVHLRATPASRVTSSVRCIPKSPRGPMPA